MLKKLQDKWKVNGKNVLLILVTFAAGGSLCGIAGKKIMNFTGLEKGFLWLVTYVIILTIIWPICVLLISFPLGQFNFFTNYIGKIVKRFGGKAVFGSGQLAIGNKQPVVGNEQTRLAIFASGTGTNAEKIIVHFKNNFTIKIVLIVCNNPDAGVLEIAKKNNIDILLIEKQRFVSGDNYINELIKYKIHWIILAGFLWKLPVALVKAWPLRIINIHPALLPGYGGKGMYGQHVHQAIIAAGEKESGISIHYVDELYDNGEIIMQVRCQINPSDNAETLAQKIYLLEHHHFATVIEQEILKAKNPLKESNPGDL